MNYIDSEDIKVFPSTYRTEYTQGKYTSEHNFINILNSITDVDSYILTWDNSMLRFVIHGYYFEVTDAPFESTQKNVWVGIKVENGSTSSNALINVITNGTVLDNDNNQFEGLGWIQSVNKPTFGSSSDYSEYWLRLTDNTGKITSRVRLNAESIKYDSQNSVKDELDKKQYNLVTGDGITLNKNSNTISIESSQFDKLESLKNKGSNIQHVYFNSDGKAVASLANIGTGYTTESNYGKAQNVYISGGQMKAGQTIYASVNTPSNTQGQVGDIWFKYTI